jgi:molecular chaperone DnaJ
MAVKRDYYEILGIEKGAAGDDIKRAYRQLARKYHPDVNPGDKDSEEKFKEVAEAYEVLSDDQKRTVYDRFGHNAPGGGASFDGFSGGGFGDIFEMFFGQGGGRRGGGPQRGDDLRYDLEVTLEQALSGGETTVRVQRVETCEVCTGTGAEPGTRPDTCVQCGGVGQVRQTQQTILGTFQTMSACPRCGGRGQVVSSPCKQCTGRGRIRRAREIKVPIPAGVDEGMQLPLRGEGEGGVFGGPPGDLYVFYSVKPHSRFERQGADLFCELSLTFTQAALGDEMPVTTLAGETVSVTIPEGTQAGARFRLRGHGMPDVRTRGKKGDLTVVTRVDVPTRMTDEQKKALRHFAELRGEKTGQGEPHPKGFFERVKDAVLGGDE